MIVARTAYSDEQLAQIKKRQHALGYKAGLKAAVQVAIEFAENSVEEEVAAIKALPVPEVEWQDLTDDDYALLLKSNRIFDFQSRAVIAKFKEVNK